MLAEVFIAIGALSAIANVMDLARGHRHEIAIMNVVWPITALYMGPVAVWEHWQSLHSDSEDKPFWWTVFVGATHCGAGCTIGDCIGEWIHPHSLWARFGIDFARACRADAPHFGMAGNCGGDQSRPGIADRI